MELCFIDASVEGRGQPVYPIFPLTYCTDSIACSIVVCQRVTLRVEGERPIRSLLQSRCCVSVKGWLLTRYSHLDETRSQGPAIRGFRAPAETCPSRLINTEGMYAINQT